MCGGGAEAGSTWYSGRVMVKNTTGAKLQECQALDDWLALRGGSA